ncbi:MAG: hypothetical protein H7Z72_10405 [Bacteroidetes bacterium]|nr:hypothetical protein [Fibrella sp.]
MTLSRLGYHPLTDKLSPKAADSLFWVFILTRWTLKIGWSTRVNRPAFLYKQVGVGYF